MIGVDRTERSSRQKAAKKRMLSGVAGRSILTGYEGEERASAAAGGSRPRAGVVNGRHTHDFFGCVDRLSSVVVLEVGVARANSSWRREQAARVRQ